MKGNFLKIFIQLAIAMGLYYLFDYLNLLPVFIVIAVILFVFMIALNVMKVKNKEVYLEIACDANLYLNKLNQYTKPHQRNSDYFLGLAYAYIYKGEYDVAQEHLNHVVFSEIKDQKKYLPIFLRVQSKLAYERKDEEALKSLLNESSTNELPEEFKGYIKAQILLLREQYEEVIEVLMDLIPKQFVRIHIIELEYYLAIAYIQNKQLEDARAVLEFIVKKGYSIVYTDLAYELYMSIKE